MMFSSCKEDDGSGYTFRVNITDNPQNLDPQMASDSSSKMIIMNTYTGLVKISENGSIENSAAESYKLSDDGLTYTFKLKDNIYWYGSDDYTAQMTANDFVFAFQRIFNKETVSPYVKQFSCIKNSYEVMNGLTDVKNLGVRAQDDFTLVFELEYPYYNFLEMLTLTAAMPCNKEYFEKTKGRYGLAADASASNGAFYIKEWNYDPYWDNNYIILRRNRFNHEHDTVYPYSVNFFITGDHSADIDDYTADKIDCLILDEYNKKLIEDNKYISCQSKAYGLVFNPESEFFNNIDLRYSLSTSVNRNEYKKILPENLSIANGIIPDAITILGRSYRELIPDAVMTVYAPDRAADIWNSTLNKNNIASIDGVKITVMDSFNGSGIINNITEQWQKTLNFFCGVEIVSANEYNLKISTGNYDILLLELKAGYNDANEFLKLFSMNDVKNNIKHKNLNFESIINRIDTADRLNTAVKLFTEAETLIISESIYIPLFYGNEYLLYSKDADGLKYYPFTEQILFKDAKMY